MIKVSEKFSGSFSKLAIRRETAAVLPKFLISDFEKSNVWPFISISFNAVLMLFKLISLLYCTAIRVPPLKSILNFGPLFDTNENIPVRINIADKATADKAEFGWNFELAYGMSEIQALYARRSHELTPGLRYLPGGKLVSRQAKVRVRNPDTGDLLPHNQSGELEFKGPSLMKEYFGDQLATSKSFTSDGYLRSGDLGYTTSESEFVFEARMGDTFRLGGYLVSPIEIENVITEHKAIEAAQVVAVRVSNKMQPYGFVVAKNDMEINDELLRAHCEERIAKFKVPVAFQCIAQFPTTKSPNGTKIQRAKLRQMAEEALEYDALD